jgi:hypothetical protein
MWLKHCLVWHCIYRGFLILVVPDCIHAKAGFFDVAMSNTAEELIVPPVDLDEALLIVGES